MPNCKICKKDFNVDKEPGAILVSPPFQSINPTPVGDIHRKYHICKYCYSILINWISEQEIKRNENHS
jgi:hypothetical protein